LLVLQHILLLLVRNRPLSVTPEIRVLLTLPAAR
jgi:hypothetical protein